MESDSPVRFENPKNFLNNLDNIGTYVDSELMLNKGLTFEAPHAIYDARVYSDTHLGVDYS